MTAKYRKFKNLFFWLSTLCWLGLCGFLVVFGLCTSFAEAEGSQVTSIGSQMVGIFMPLIVTYGIALLLIVFIREKARNTVWMVNIVLTATLFGSAWMYAAIAMFALDEFVFHPLYKHYKNKLLISKEIDKRL